MRTCVTCGVEKPETEFYPKRVVKGKNVWEGLDRNCKTCKRGNRKPYVRVRRDPEVSVMPAFNVAKLWPVVAHGRV